MRLPACPNCPVQSMSFLGGCLGRCHIGVDCELSFLPGQEGARRAGRAGGARGPRRGGGRQAGRGRAPAGRPRTRPPRSAAAQSGRPACAGPRPAWPACGCTRRPPTRGSPPPPAAGAPGAVSLPGPARGTHGAASLPDVALAVPAAGPPLKRPAGLKTCSMRRRATPARRHSRACHLPGDAMARGH